MSLHVQSKEDARREVMNVMKGERVFRFPFMPSRRIPNFKGSDKASLRLFEFREIKAAEVVKCNPDSPQRSFREEALRRGKILLVPTPRLANDFLLLDPRKIPPDSFGQASRSSQFSIFGVYCSLEDIPQPDVTVVGSVAVNSQGGRCGKGHGYADLESAMLRAVGLKSTPVFTTAHPLQLAKPFSTDITDLLLTGVATEERVIRFREDVPPWPPLQWDALSDQQIDAMPLLQALRPTGG